MEKKKIDSEQLPQTKKLVERILDIVDLSDWVSYSNVVKNGIFLVFLLALGILYVANTHLAERTVRKINKKEVELKELRWEYMTLKSNLMYERKQSELAKKLTEAGIVEIKEPPKKIVVERRAY